jgi:hypothetical protein
MKPHEIVTHFAQKLGVDPKLAHQLADQKISEGMRDAHHNNTLMFYKLVDDHSCFVHFVSADTPLGLISSMSYFMNMLKSHGVDKIYMNTKDKGDVVALASIGVHLGQSDNPQYPYMGMLE